MNIYQIRRELEELITANQELDNTIIDIDNVLKEYSDYDSSIDDWTIDWILSKIDESSPYIANVTNKSRDFKNIIHNCKINGLEPVPKLPEHARHLWSICDMTTEIYCQRNKLSKYNIIENTKNENPTEQLLPIFVAATEGQNIARKLVYSEIDMNEFEKIWKKEIINPIYDVITSYASDNMTDCIELLVEAFLEEENRNTEILAQKEV